MLNKRILSVILIAVLSLSLVACGNKTDEAYLYFELPKVPSTLDPQTASSDSELLIVKNIYEGLMRKNIKGEAVCGAAESFEKQGLTYTFKLRDKAVWSNGDPVTAEDFVFGLKRAVDPSTKASFASRLFAIKNAQAINEGKISADQLGVTAVDDLTIKIELSFEDSEFLDNLTTSVAMPCNQEFFNSSGGKYGLFKENIICNSSYRLTKWNKESFGIRLYRNEQYGGDFYAKNAAVFLTCNDDEPVTQKLTDSHIDIAFINPEETDNMNSQGFKTHLLEDTCWVMSFDNTLSQNMRISLMKAINREGYQNNLKTGYYVANSLYPTIITGGEKQEFTGIIAYDLQGSKDLFTSEIRQLDNNKFPSNILLYYYDNGISKNVVTDIVGHWQSNLGAFINIEAVTSEDTLLPQLRNQTLAISVFPVRAVSRNKNEYLKNFGDSLTSKSLADAQSELLKSKNLIPLFFQSTAICYSPTIKEISFSFGDGFIDFSMIVKDI